MGNFDSVALPAIRLPAAQQFQGLALRAETEADTAFLQRLYGSTREDIALVDWPDTLKREFLLGQFAAQRHHYRSYYPDAAYDVLQKDDEPIGRLYLDERESRLHILDIALLPEWRGRGIGSAILKAILEIARDKGKGVDIFVERFNPALKLYERLGFVHTGDADFYLELEWMPEPAQDQLNEAQ